MESLFSRLFKYKPSEHRNPTEDFFTEIFAFLLENVDGLLAEILNRFKVIPQGRLETMGVKTQCQFNTQSGDIRPDIFVRFSADNEEWLLFIENKIGAREGKRQLERYWSYLRNESDKGLNCVLFYMTQFYDSEKAIPSEWVGEKGKILFSSREWWEIYEILKKFETQAFVAEATLYMTEMGMSMPRKFSQDHITAMTHWNTVRKMMDKSLRGKVEDRFKVITEISRIPQADSLLRNQGNYLYAVDKSFWVEIGYYFPSGDTSDENYPYAGGAIGVYPDHSKALQIATALERFANKYPDWELDGDLENDEGISIEKLSLLKEGDDISSIQDWFLEILSDMETFKNDNRELSWD